MQVTRHGATLKKRIIFHIGTHKTGSSSIQRSLYSIRKDLLKNGIIYPEIAFGPRAELKKHEGLFLSLQRGGSEIQNVMDEVRGAFRRSGADTMVLSEEALGVLPSRQPDSLSALIPLRTEFDFESICFLRRPDYFLESFWNQICKEGKGKQHIGAFQQSQWARTYLRYEAFLSEWSKVSDLRVFGFETSRDKGVVQTFCDAVGIPPPAKEFQVNVSPSMTCAAILAALARSSGKHYDWHLIERELGSDTRKTALGKRLRRKILFDFLDERRKVEDKYGVVFPNSLPEEPQEMLPRPQAAEVARFDKPEFLLQSHVGDALLISRLRRRLRRIRDAFSKR